MRKVFIVLLVSCVALLAIDSFADVLAYEGFGDAVNGSIVAGYSGTSAESGLTGSWTLYDGGSKTFDVDTDIAVGIDGGHSPEVTNQSQHLTYSDGWDRTIHTRPMETAVNLNVDGVYYISFFAVSDGSDDFAAEVGIYDGTNALLCGQGYNRGINAIWGDISTLVDSGNDQVDASYSSGDTGFYLVTLTKTNSGSTDDLEVKIDWWNLSDNNRIFNGADVTRIQTFTDVSGSFDNMAFTQDGWCWMDEFRICDSMESATGGISEFLPVANDMSRVILDLGTERFVEDYTFSQTGSITVGWDAVAAWNGLEGSFSSSGIRDGDSSDDDDWYGEQTHDDPGFYQVTDVNMVEGITYAFTAYNRNRWSAGGVNMSIISSDAPNSSPNSSLATATHEVLHEDGWQEIYVAYTATAADVGKYIGVQFEGFSENMGNSWFRVDDVHLYEDYYRLDVVGVTDNMPDGSEMIPAGRSVDLTWTPSNEPNLVGQTVVYSVSDISPDIATYLASPITVSLDETGTTCNIGTVDHDQWIIWRVDSLVDVNSVTHEPVTYTGETYVVSVESADFAPVVTAGSGWLTYVGGAMPTLTADIDDLGEGDIYDSDVEWTVDVPWEPVDAAVVQMKSRTTVPVGVSEPNMIQDWMGADCRVSNSWIFEPMVITISGVPSGTYDFTSYHHDSADQTDNIKVTVIDANGEQDAVTVDQSNGEITTENPLATFTATVVSDGGDIQIVLDNVDGNFTMINGFVLSDGMNADLAVDFGLVDGLVEPGWQVYEAEDEQPSTFTQQMFDALGTTGIGVLPEWGPGALGKTVTVTKTSTDPLAPTASFFADTAGDYTVTITASDDGGTQGVQTSSDTLIVRVAPNACDGAISWGDGYYDSGDFDSDCDVDLNDFAVFASDWLADSSIAGTAPVEE